jgi:hypothetical protein
MSSKRRLANVSLVAAPLHCQLNLPSDVQHPRPTTVRFEPVQVEHKNEFLLSALNGAGQLQLLGA